jgi:hypothetical protein
MLFEIAAHRCFETNLVWSMRGSLEARKLGRRAGRAALSANCLQADRHARGRLGRRAGRAAVSANSLEADRHARGRLVSTDFTRLNIVPELDPPSRRRHNEWNNRNLKKRSS